MNLGSARCLGYRGLTLVQDIRTFRTWCRRLSFSGAGSIDLHHKAHHPKVEIAHAVNVLPITSTSHVHLNASAGAREPPAPSPFDPGAAIDFNQIQTVCINGLLVKVNVQ
jgi:hypothetical protein